MKARRLRGSSLLPLGCKYRQLLWMDAVSVMLLSRPVKLDLNTWNKCNKDSEDAVPDGATQQMY
jgi:hypothetical protein